MSSTTTMTLFCLLSAYFTYSCTAQDSSDKAEITDLGAHFNKFAYMDVDKILADNSLLDNYINCFLNKGPCDDVGNGWKKAIPVVAATGCTGCSDKQLQNIKNALKIMKTKRVPQWAQMIELYDPTGVNLNKFTE